MYIVICFAWLFIVIQWLDIVRELLASKASRLPAGVTSQSDAKAAVETLTGGSLLAKRARALLSAYAAGWGPSELAALADHQARRSLIRSFVSGAFMLLVFAACIGASFESQLAWIGIAVLGGTMFARVLLLGRVESLIDDQLVAKLPASIAGTGITADALGKALGGSIENAFKQYVPQPEKFAAAITTALDNARKSLDEAAAQLKTGLAGGGDKLAATLASGGDKLLAGVSGSADKLQAALTAPAQQLEKAASSLGGQADKLLSASGQLEKLMAASQAVEGALKSLGGSDAFKQTLASFQSHLAESDKLLREAAKPRTIKLVEHDNG